MLMYIGIYVLINVDLGLLCILLFSLYKALVHIINIIHYTKSFVVSLNKPQVAFHHTFPFFLYFFSLDLITPSPQPIIVQENP